MVIGGVAFLPAQFTVPPPPPGTAPGGRGVVPVGVGVRDGVGEYEYDGV
jgi:hypothetical protein